MKHVVRLLLSLLLSFNLVVTPAWAEDATATTDADECKENDNSDSNKYNCQKKEGSNTLTTRGEKYSPGYLEMLMMLTLAMVMLTSPLPTRTQRAKNDCQAQFAGPIGLMLMKLGGIVQIAGEITTAIKYNKVIKDYKKKHDDKDMSVYDTVGSTANETTSDKDKVKEQKKTKEKVLDMKATYEGYAEVFKEQQDVLKMKNGFYSATLAMIVTALAIETTLASICTASCVARWTTYTQDKATNEAALSTYNIALEAAVDAFTGVLAVSPYPAVLVQAAHKSLTGTITQFITTSESLFAKNVGLAEGKGVKQRTNQAKDWSKVAADWASALAPGVSEAVGAIGSVKAGLEEAQEISDMSTNSTNYLSSFTTSIVDGGVIAGLETNLLVQAGLDVAAAAPFCVSWGVVGTPVCEAKNAAALVALEAAIVAAKAPLYAIHAKMIAASTGVNAIEEGLAKAGGGAISAMEKAFASLNTAQVDIAGKVTDAAATAAQKAAQTAISKGVSIAAIKTILTMAPYAANEIENQAFRMTCCGSDGVFGFTPANLMPIPATPGLIFTRADITPPKGLLQTNLNKKQQNEIDKIFKTVMNNYHYEEVIAHASNSFDPKNPKKLSQQFEVMEAQIANLDLNKKKMTPQDVKELKAAFFNIANMVGMPRAEANDAMKKMGPMMLIGGGLVVGMMMRKIVKKIYAFATKAPVNRIAFYALITALNASLIDGVKKNQKRIDEQLGIIYKLKDMTEEQMMGGAEFQLGTAQNNQAMGGGQGDGGQVDEVLKKSSSNTCLNVTSSDVASAPCGNKQNLTSLHPSEMKDLNANFPAFSSATNSMTNLTSDFASGNNGNPGNFSSAQMGQFGSIQSAMRTRLDKAKKDLDKYAKEKNGKSTVDKMVAEIISSISKSDPSLAGLAAHSPFPISGASVTPSLGGAGKDKNAPTTASVPPTFKMPAVPGYGGDSLGTMETPIEETPVEAPTAGATDSLDNYEVSQNDIVKQKDVSIFQVLSKRYLLSYPKILKKQAEPKAEPAPSP